ncbi:winged helix-turn-helix domain-containing protein [Salinarimonas soli]|uniref:Winged helix-turn-helix domain-containing protein n=2 Tax=Salinarimonas soli TaxID=1638099 RepID=A0A5B2VIS9_9HYPH|nr:winged helix-turn-helix domain-containing protein [Salinarimonas soli]
MASAVSLSARDARRIALAAQGLTGARPPRPSRGRLDAMLGRLGMVQIDSVNVLARAHYMPGFSRLGAYAVDHLHEAAYGRRRHLFEYWGHEASLIRLDLQPALRWRMSRAGEGRGIYGGLARFGRERPDFIAEVLRQVETRGALSARELEDCGRSAGSWWGWSDGKRALEWLFWAGRVTTAARRGFERVYDLPERVLPAEILAAPTPSDEEAHRTLVRVAAGALGVATERDLRDYWRLDPPDARAAICALVDEGDLLPASVEGWDTEAYLAPGAAAPARLKARALVSPFDPLLWERPRAERLFGMRYRIEIYTPAHLREHGYYVLPFLWGDRLAARVDLKADRKTRRLLVQAAHLEPRAPPDTAAALADELGLLGTWLDLDEIAVAARGDLAPALAAATRLMPSAPG